MEVQAGRLLAGGKAPARLPAGRPGLWPPTAGYAAEPARARRSAPRAIEG